MCCHEHDVEVVAAAVAGAVEPGGYVPVESDRLVSSDFRKNIESALYTAMTVICDGTFGPVRNWSLSEAHYHGNEFQGTSLCCRFDKMVNLLVEALEGP